MSYQIKNTIWSDGTYNPSHNTGGAAVVIERANGELMSITRKLPNILVFTEAEMFEIWINLLLSKRDTRI